MNTYMKKKLPSQFCFKLLNNKNLNGKIKVTSLLAVKSIFFNSSLYVNTQKQMIKIPIKE